MPPRFAYWTILVDDQPTAFRAKEAEELLPTLNRLKEKHPSAVLMWFQAGKLWRSRTEAQDAFVAARREEAAKKKRAAEHPPRDRKWRPGGEHRDPRQKYKDARKAKWTRFKERIRQGARPRPPGKSDRPFPTAGSDRPRPPQGERPRQPWKTDRPPTEARSDRPRPPGPHDRPRQPWQSDRPRTSGKSDRQGPRSTGVRPKPPWKSHGPKPEWKGRKRRREDEE